VEAASRLAFSDSVEVVEKIGQPFQICWWGVGFLTSCSRPLGNLGWDRLVG
jgi:hypothetical protein